MTRNRIIERARSTCRLRPIDPPWIDDDVLGLAAIMAFVAILIIVALAMAKEMLT